MTLHTLISAQAASLLEALPSLLEDFLAFRAENVDLGDADSIAKYLAKTSKSVRKPSLRRRKGKRANGNHVKQPPSPWLNFLKANRAEIKDVLLNFSDNESEIRELFFAPNPDNSEEDVFLQETFDRLVSKLPAEDNPERRLDVAAISIYAGRRWRNMSDEEKAEYKAEPAVVEEPAAEPASEVAVVEEPAAEVAKPKTRKVSARKARKPAL